MYPTHVGAASCPPVVALLDALFAIVLYVLFLHVATPARVFQPIAAPLLGRASFDGGAHGWVGTDHSRQPNQ